MNLDDLMHFTLKEWTRMSIAPTVGEVERAKSQLKAGLLLSLDGTTAVAEDIGRQLVTSGTRLTPLDIERSVDAVTVDEIKRVAQKYLWDKDVSTTLSIRLGSTKLIFIYLCRSLWPLLEISKVSWTTTASVLICPLWSIREICIRGDGVLILVFCWCSQPLCWMGLSRDN